MKDFNLRYRNGLKVLLENSCRLILQQRNINSNMILDFVRYELVGIVEKIENK